MSRQVLTKKVFSRFMFHVMDPALCGQLFQCIGIALPMLTILQRLGAIIGPEYRATYSTSDVHYQVLAQVLHRHARLKYISNESRVSCLGGSKHY